MSLTRRFHIRCYLIIAERSLSCSTVLCLCYTNNWKLSHLIMILCCQVQRSLGLSFLLHFKYAVANIGMRTLCLVMLLKHVSCAL